MKKITLVLALIMAMVAPVMADSYYGTYVGKDYGCWSAYHDPTGGNESFLIMFSYSHSHIYFSEDINVTTEGRLTATMSNGMAITVDIADEVSGTWGKGSDEGAIMGEYFSEVPVASYSLVKSNGITLELSNDNSGYITGIGSDSIKIRGLVTPDGDIYLKNFLDLRGGYGGATSGMWFDSYTGTYGTYRVPPEKNPQALQTLVPYLEVSDSDSGGCFINSIF